MILLITLSVIIIICLSLYYRRFSAFSQEVTSDCIPLSALITIYNNVNENLNDIVHNINLLIEQNIPIYIIDDGSTDNSIQLLQKQFKDSEIHFITLKNQGKYKAIFSSLKKIETVHFLMIDADVKLTKKMLEVIQKVDIKYDWVQTGIIHKKPNKFIHSFSFIDQLLLQKTAFITMNSSYSIIGVGACARINKEKYLSIFENSDIRYGGDMLMISELDKNNQLMISPKYDITTSYATSLAKLIQQRKRWALNNKNGTLNIISTLGFLFWIILLYTSPLCIISSLINHSITPLLILLPILGSFILFLHQRINLINLVSFIIYLIFGWVFYIIILILITFGQFQKQKS